MMIDIPPTGDAFVRRETRQVQEELQADLLRTVSQLKTPNILLIGRTGVGSILPRVCVCVWRNASI